MRAIRSGPLGRRSIMLAGIGLAAFSAGAARAADDVVAADEIIVTGTRPIAESESAALAIQKNSDSLVSVLAADAIGRLPDQNVAQAISRLPGVAVQRDQGQARFVNLRGAPLNWTTLSFDGIFVVSPEGRNARFDSIPSALASQIVVQKAVTPDLNGETIAGNVNIVTRSAFDYSGLHFQSKVGAGYVELGGGTEYEGSVVLSNRWNTGIGDIGVVVSGSYYQRNQVTDNFEIDWESVSRDLRPLAAGESEQRIWAREIENKFYRLTRRNYSGTGKLEWRPDDNNSLFLSSVYTVFTDNELRDNYRIDADDQQGRVPNSTAPCPAAGVQAPAPFTTGYADVCTGNTPLLGTVFGVDFDARFRKTDRLQSVFTNTIGGDHKLNNWTVKWRGNYTRSEDDRSDPYLLTYTQPGFGTNGVGGVDRVTADYDFRDPQNSQVRLFRTLRDANGVFSRGAGISSFESLPNNLNSARALRAVDITDAYTARLELGVDTQFLGDTTFRFGGQYDRRTKEANESESVLSGSALTTLLNANSIGSTLNSLLGNDPFNGKIDPGYTIRHFSDERATSIINTVQANTPFRSIDQNFYRVREEVWSGYAMGTTRFDWGNVVYGARIEHVKNSGTAFVAIPGIGTSLVTVDNDVTLVFPSLHINWVPRDDMKVRLSFNTGAARPDYTDLSPRLTVNDADEVISGGNPFAEPEKAKGVDLYWEWYLKPRGFISLGAFYKDVSDVLFESTRIFGSDSLNGGAVADRSQYRLNALVNGGDGYIWGFEGAFQMQLDSVLDTDSFIGGFGIQANFTYNKSEATTPDGRKVAFPGTSRWVTNIGPYFEKYGLSVRASYQRRTDWFSELGTLEDTGGDLFWATDDELDVSARYAITPNLEVYVDGSNLLNGPGRRFAGVSQRTLERETFGPRVSGGFRLTY